jgi:hypothetical protein
LQRPRPRPGVDDRLIADLREAVAFVRAHAAALREIGLVFGMAASAEMQRYGDGRAELVDGHPVQGVHASKTMDHRPQTTNPWSPISGR